MRCERLQELVRLVLVFLLRPLKKLYPVFAVVVGIMLLPGCWDKGTQSDEKDQWGKYEAYIIPNQLDAEVGKSYTFVLEGGTWKEEIEWKWEVYKRNSEIEGNVQASGTQAVVVFPEEGFYVVKANTAQRVVERGFLGCESDVTVRKLVIDPFQGYGWTGQEAIFRANCFSPPEDAVYGMYSGLALLMDIHHPEDLVE